MNAIVMMRDDISLANACDGEAQVLRRVQITPDELAQDDTAECPPHRYLLGHPEVVWAGAQTVVYEVGICLRCGAQYRRTRQPDTAVTVSVGSAGRNPISLKFDRAKPPNRRAPAGSPYVGVFPSPQGWYAKVWHRAGVRRTPLRFGPFGTPEDARDAYQDAYQRYVVEAQEPPAGSRGITMVGTAVEKGQSVGSRSAA